MGKKRTKATLLIIIVSALAVFAQDIDLTGKVTNDSGGLPLNNVIVTLKNMPALKDTTGTDGTYQLKSTTGVVHGFAGERSFSGNRLNNGVLEIGVIKKEPLTVETYSLNGVLKARLAHDDIMAPGLYKFDMRKSCANTNMYLLKVRQGDNTTTYPVLSLNASFTKNISTDKRTGMLAKSETFADTIIFSLNGFTTAKKAVAAATGENDIALVPLWQSQTVTDIDGNVYHTVAIGTQVWMVENLKTTKYNDGTSIPLVTDAGAWTALSYTSPGFCWYNNDTANKNTYGALYNWHAINTGNIAPTGWHIPSSEEWNTLTTYLGSSEVAGGKLKETGTTHWASPNTGATNETGFSALPGGSRNIYGTFLTIFHSGAWWTCSLQGSDEGEDHWLVVGCGMNNTSASVISGNSALDNGFSVRCIKN